MSFETTIRNGGWWLAAIRNWVKSHCINGDRVYWGSTQTLQPPLSVRDVEEIGAIAAIAAVEEYKKSENIACKPPLPICGDDWYHLPTNEVWISNNGLKYRIVFSDGSCVQGNTPESYRNMPLLEKQS